jgi:hypothetical protein
MVCAVGVRRIVGLCENGENARAIMKPAIHTITQATATAQSVDTSVHAAGFESRWLAINGVAR